MVQLSLKGPMIDIVDGTWKNRDEDSVCLTSFKFPTNLGYKCATPT